MACRYTYKGKTYSATEFDDVLRAMSPTEAGRYSTIVSPVPSAPFVTKTEAWSMLAMKRMIRYAAENGFDRIAWTTGTQQADRYDLSKKVRFIAYRVNGDGGYELSLGLLNGNTETIRPDIEADKLADHVGKDVADKIIAGEGLEVNYAANNEKPDIRKELRGLDLKVGGTGMRAFYDQMLPQMVNKYVKKWGGKVEKIAVEKVGEVDEEGMTVQGQYSFPAIDITPAMRESVMQGQPLFSRNKVIPNKYGKQGFDLPEETSGQTFIRKQQNKLNRIEIVQDAIREQGGKVGTTEDVYQAMERMTGRTAHQQKQFTLNTVVPLMKRVSAIDTNLEELGTYLMALGAKDRNAYIQTKRQDMPDNGSGMTDAEAAQIIADYKLRPRFSEFDRLARDIQKITVEKLKRLVTGKVITQANADEMNAKMGFYVPYKGFEIIDDAGNKVGNGTGGGYSTSKRVSKRAYGRASRAGQVVENIFRDYHAAIFLTEKALVGEYMRNLVEANPDATLWAIGQPVKTPVMGADGQVQYRDMGYDNTQEIRYIRDGQELRIQVFDPLFVAAYNNLNAEQFGAIAQTAAEFNSFLRQVYVQKNPNFLWRNTVRDSQTAFIALTGEIGIVDAAKAMRLAPGAAKAAFSMVRDKKAGTAWDAYIDLYHKSGAGTAFAMLDDIETQQLKLEETIAKHGSQGLVQTWKRGIEVWNNAKAVKGSTLTKYGKAITKESQFLVYRALDNAVFNGLEALSGASENAFRLAAFRQYIDSHGGIKSVTPTVLKEASRISKNLTVNFNRGGEMSSKLNAFYLFWKASVNGAANVHRVLTDTSHKRQAQALTAGLFALGVSMAFLTGDDDELSSEYDKDHNLLIHGDGTTWKLILAYGFGFFYGAGYTIGNMLRGRVTPIKAAVKITGMFFEHFTPVGSPVIKGEFNAKAVALMASPTLLDPLMVVATNQTPFGNKLVPHYTDDDGKPDRTTMYRGTRGTLYDKAANSAVLAWADISPETMKYMVNTLTGGSGGFVSDAAKTAMDAFTTGKEIETERIPLVNTMYNTKDVEEYRGRFYTQLDDVKKTAAGEGKKQRQVLPGQTVMRWQMRMKKLREDEQEARDKSNWKSVYSIEKEQIELSNDLNKSYHEAMRGN